MIDPTLAKQLKETGFFQPFQAGFNVPEDRYFIERVEKEEAEYSEYGGFFKRMFVPNLSELIWACGKDFVFLRQQADASWMATGGNEDFPEGSCEVEDTSPEAAVARLWIQLNKK